MEQWIQNPVLLKPDNNAKYAATIEIDLNEIKELLIKIEHHYSEIPDLFKIFFL